MKKGVLVAVVGILVLSLIAGCSRGYVAQKTASGLNITLKAARYPLVKGDNALSVSVSDSSGKAVGDAMVMAHYYMPPMAGMAPMAYDAMAQAKGGSYALTANIPMEGGWRIDVTVTQPGTTPVAATFNVDAR